MSIGSQLRGEQGQIPARGIHPDAADPHGDLARLRHYFKTPAI